MVTHETVDDVFRALGDPTRRAILLTLGKGQEPVQAVADRFPAISRPAVSKHLRILRECGLVEEERVGRQRVYSRVGGGLAPARQWLAAVEGSGTGSGMESGQRWQPASDAGDWRSW